MQGIHDARSATKYLEGQIISYLYGGTDETGLNRCVRKITSTYKVSPRDVKQLIDAVERNSTTYYGGRYRLAYGAIGRRFGEANFIEGRHRQAMLQSLREVTGITMRAR